MLPEPTASTWLTAWTFTVVPSLLAILISVAYGWGLLRLRGTGVRWPLARTLALIAGVAVIVYAGNGAVAVYAHRLLWVFTTQFVLLLLVAPLLVAFGAPVTLATSALGPVRAVGLVNALDTPLLRTLSLPVIGPIVLALVPVIVFFTPLLTWMLTNRVVGAGMQILLVILGFLSFWSLADSARSERIRGYPIAILVAFLELIVDAIPGIVLRLSTHLVAASYWLSFPRDWGPSPLRDQQLSGAVLWFVGEAVDLPFLLLLLAGWMRSDRREAAVIDARLDAEEARRQQDGQEPESTNRPWWETDGGVFGDRFQGH